MTSQRLFALASFVVAAQFAVISALAVTIGFNEWPPFTKYLSIAAACFGASAVGLAAYRLRGMPPSPMEHLRQFDWSSVKQFALLMVLVWLQFVVLTWAKVMLPVAAPFWADPFLASWDAEIFGADAWRVIPNLNRVLVWPYALWPFAVFAGLAVAFFKKRHVEALAFFLTVGLLGTFGQYLLPSAGPIFYERLGLGGRFADLPFPGGAYAVSNYLWSAYERHSADFAAGISAFPSVHVATAFWLILATRSWAAFAFFLCILIGSVTIGWHYAVDGIAGAVGAALCFGLATLAAREGRSRDRVAAV